MLKEQQNDFEVADQGVDEHENCDHTTMGSCTFYCGVGTCTRTCRKPEGHESPHRCTEHADSD